MSLEPSDRGEKIEKGNKTRKEGRKGRILMTMTSPSVLRTWETIDRAGRWVTLHNPDS